MDFDNTILDFDALEKIIGMMAPDILPMWTSIHQPQNFVPMTNAVFGAMQRRGISEETILAAIRKIATHNFPPGSVATLRHAKALPNTRLVILSDCNDLVIRTMLEAVDCLGCVDEIVTNTAQFARGTPEDAATAGPTSVAPASSADGPARTRMVVYPRHPWSKPPHGCPYCPANLCKGAELQQLRRERCIAKGHLPACGPMLTWLPPLSFPRPAPGLATESCGGTGPRAATSASCTWAMAPTTSALRSAWPRTTLSSRGRVRGPPPPGGPARLLVAHPSLTSLPLSVGFMLERLLAQLADAKEDGSPMPQARSLVWADHVELHSYITEIL